MRNPQLYYIESTSLTSLTVDYTQLCPYCNTKLPPNPSRRLQKLLTRVKKKSWPLPKWNNPLALNSELHIVSTFCAAHAEEEAVIPEGKRRGWPANIDFDDLPGRLKAFKGALAEIVEEPGVKSPVFFDEALQEWRENGALVMGGAMAQMSGMDRSQPG